MSARAFAALVAVGALGVGAIALVRRAQGGPRASRPLRDLDTPFGTLGHRRNVTDEIDPAPEDVNDPAPPGSPIVGEAHDGFSAEEHRIQNLQRRWRRLERWSFLQRRPPLEVLQSYDRWRTFGTRRELRSMAGWTDQFEALIRAEDWAAARGFQVRREDTSHLDDREWEASLR